MKIKFNVEISKKEGLKENTFNANGEIELSAEELKSIIITQEPANVEQEKNAEVTEELSKKYTVVVGASKEFFYVRNNPEKKYYFMCPSLLKPQELILMREVDSKEFSNAAKYNIGGDPVYDTNELDFLEGRKIKEVV